jgi:23S rRNA (uracil1939-C5)-methyltransferase
MGSKRRKKSQHRLLITGAGAKGKAIARLEDGKTVLVSGAVPGDEVLVEVYRQKRAYAEARTLEILKASPDRIDPACKHFENCGGCTWQHLDYPAQLRFKENEVKQNLTRIGHLELPEVEPIMASASPFYYRNKMEYSFSTHRWLTSEEVASGEDFSGRNALGFHAPGRWDRVIDIEHCHLQPEPSNRIRNWFREYARTHDLSFYHPYDKVGALRSLMIRTALTGEVMTLVQFGPCDVINHQQVMKDMQTAFPEITTGLYTVNHKGNESLYDQDIQVAWGPGYIVEKMQAYAEGGDDLHFHIGPKTFYQTNALQAESLYRVALDFLQPQANELLYDLYTGIGTIALYASSQVKKVIGVELVEDSIANAKENARRNGIENAAFFAGDMKDVLTQEFIDTHGTPDTLIVDPPREGLHPSVVETILSINPQRWVYISCNSATQARDLALVDEHYRVAKYRPVDMFPHTHHVENVVLMERRLGV